MARTQVTGGNIADSSVSLTVDVNGVLPVVNGGTGTSTFTSGAVLLGNGGSTPTTVSPGASGNILKSNGSVWAAVPDSAAALNATVATSETTTSTTYTDLTTTTDSVTLVIGTSGLALVAIFAQMSSSTTAASYMGFAVSGSTTIAAADSKALRFFSPTAGSIGAYGATFLMTGLTAGSNTFKLKYKVASGTSTFVNRNIGVVPL